MAKHKPTKLTIAINKAIDRYHTKHPGLRVSTILASLEDIRHCLTEAMVKPKRKARGYDEGEMGF